MNKILVRRQQSCTSCLGTCRNPKVVFPNMGVSLANIARPSSDRLQRLKQLVVALVAGPGAKKG